MKYGFDVFFVSYNGGRFKHQVHDVILNTTKIKITFNKHLDFNNVQITLKQLKNGKPLKSYHSVYVGFG